ncbi:MAG: restriction endonuclease [Candidatus Methanomethylophilaceae archaeon]
MVMPTYDELFGHVLSALSDGKVHTAIEIRESIIPRLDLSQAELEEALPSGRQTRISNRIGWAKTSLIKAGLVEKAGYGKSRITAEGLKVLRSGVKVDLGRLMGYDTFREYQNNSGNMSSSDDATSDRTTDCTLTPDEILETSVRDLNEKIIDDLLSEIDGCDPSFFEKLVVDLLERIYGGNFSENAEVTGRSGDEGIDGVIKQDRLGFNNIYVQAKKWSNDVSRPEIQKFAGALQGQGATNGAFITSSDYSKAAREYVGKISTNTHIVLINGRDLAKLMIEYGVGVSDKTVITIKKIDTDYFHPDNE